jgi:5-methyltetrahydrofolate--homocysteine methyltransferase
MLQKIQEVLLTGETDELVTLVGRALQSGLPAARILNEGLIEGMRILGVQFKNGDVFLPEVLASAQAMNASLVLLEPHLVKDKVEPRGIVVIGTVKGDLHDIGKNLVAMMLKGAGYRIVDMGIDVSPDRFIEAAKTHGAGIIALSALLTTTMVNMKATVEAVRTVGLRIPVIVGGAPVTKEFALRIQADGYASDAASAVDEVNRLLS